MNLKLFEAETFLMINGNTYYDFDTDSKDIIKHITENINARYNKSYNAENSIGIEHDGSELYFYIGFPDKDRKGGIGWYMMTARTNYNNEIVKIDVTSCHDFYDNQLI